MLILHSGLWGSEFGQGERVQGTCIGLVGCMMIGGGSRGKDRVGGVEKGLEEASKRSISPT